MAAKPSGKKKQRKPRKKKNKNSEDELQFLDTVIAENKIEGKKFNIVRINSSFVLRCTYCQPTVGFEDLTSLKMHMAS